MLRNGIYTHFWIQFSCNVTYQIPFYEALSQLLNLKTWSSGNSAYSVFWIEKIHNWMFLSFFSFSAAGTP